MKGKKYIECKKSLDFILSLAALLVLSPFMAVIALLIKLDSKGPVFFTQKRIGKNKKPFLIYKYRTMKTEAPKDTPTHLLGSPEAYITKIGGFLRKTSLDELPQLINIVRGEMSLVGPRPALWNQNDLIRERDKYGANAVTPGLTGLAQIRGRDELPISVKARYDGKYAQNVSLLGDIKIIFLTAVKVCRRDGVREGKK